MLTTIVVVQWDKYVQCGRHICSRVYASNVGCMFTGDPGHTVHCNEFISGMYLDIAASYLHKK